MSEESSDAAQAADTPGAWLKQERERQGLAKQRIADDLHLSTQMIDAMESNQFSHLGAPVYARGHLRNYAQLLNLSVARVHELYQALNDRPHSVDPVPVMHRASEPSIPMSPDSLQRRAAQHPTRIFAVMAMVLVAAIAAAIWWWESRNVAHSRLTPIEVATVEVANLPKAQVVTANNSANIVTPSQPVSPLPSPTAAAKVIPVVATKVRLRFAFNQESWIEVYDAHGTRVLYDVGQPRQSRSVSVELPAKVTLGAANAVTIEVDGRAISVPARNISNSVARFTVAADGKVE